VVLTELHSEAQQAALRYTEALTRAADTDPDAAFQRFHDALAEPFIPEEMLEIVAVVVNMNIWTRIKLGEIAMPGLWDLIRGSDEPCCPSTLPRNCGSRGRLVDKGRDGVHVLANRSRRAGVDNSRRQQHLVHPGATTGRRPGQQDEAIER
jgi:hypothetical protein